MRKEYYLTHRKEILQQRRLYYWQNRQRILKQRKASYQQNKQKISQRVKDKYKLDKNFYRKKHYRNLYGITIEYYNQLAREQDFRCKICGKRRPLVVDHSRRKLAITLLCNQCNIALGLLEESIGTLRAAIKHIKYKLNQETKKMPVTRVMIDGKPAYRWGKSGKAYTYKAGDTQSRKRAKQSAINQGLAVAHRQGTKPEL